jgi:hypothetical protein
MPPDRAGPGRRREQRTKPLSSGARRCGVDACLDQEEIIACLLPTINIMPHPSSHDATWAAAAHVIALLGQPTGTTAPFFGEPNLPC